LGNSENLIQEDKISVYIENVLEDGCEKGVVR